MSMRAQTSLEALAAFAVLLSALALLIASAQHSASEFSKSSDASAARARLSYSALSLDTSGSTLASICIGLRPEGKIAPDGFALQDSSGLMVQEPLVHHFSGGEKSQLTEEIYEKG